MGTFKKNGKLEEHADLSPETENIELANIMAVQEDSPGRRLPEAVECSEKRGFAATAWAYDSDDHSFWDVHAQLIQYDGSSSFSTLWFFGQISYPKLHVPVSFSNIDYQ